MIPDDRAADPATESLPASARATLEAHFAAGWPTPDVPDWLSGGYVSKERLMTALLTLADYIDQATSHPDAVPGAAQDASDAPERASA